MEVKTRRVSARKGELGGDDDPLAAIDARKRARLRKAAGAWLSQQPARPYARRIRFDAIGVMIDSSGRVRALEHVQDAF